MSKKISKMLFSNQRVELALIDGIERDLNKIYDDLQRASVILQKGAIESENIGKNAILKVNSGFDSVEKAEQMAKELGVDIPEIKNLKQRFKKAESIAKEITKKATTAAN